MFRARRLVRHAWGLTHYELEGNGNYGTKHGILNLMNQIFSTFKIQLSLALLPGYHQPKNTLLFNMPTIILIVFLFYFPSQPLYLYFLSSISTISFNCNWNIETITLGWIRKENNGGGRIAHRILNFQIKYWSWLIMPKDY